MPLNGPYKHGFTLLQRLESLSIPVTESGCWIWIGGRLTTGYGKTMVNQVRMGAHRMAWIAAKGPIPDGVFVCHKCDTKLCVNPDHLFLGTAAENNKDRHKKGRSCRGAKSPYSVLTESQVLEIRQDARPLKELAAKYGVTASTIHKARQKRSWKHL